MASSTDRVFPALLKYWRHHRGMSQLDLGLAAEVSARHLSFLETGRSGPSPEMILLLCDVLDVPLRDRNAMLRSAGFDAHYPETPVDELLTGPLGNAIDTMFASHEPNPVMLVDRHYDIVRTNHSGFVLATHFVGDADDINLLTALFDPAIGGRVIENWNQVARTTLRRLQREILHQPEDIRLRALLDDVLAQPAVDPSWRTPSLGHAEEPFVPVILALEGLPRMSFLTTVTAFTAPQNVALDELMIETWFPSDAATAAACVEYLGAGLD